MTMCSIRFRRLLSQASPARGRRFPVRFIAACLPFLCIGTASAGADPGADGRPVVFAFVTDTHISVGSDHIRDLQDCIRDINARPDIEFVVFGGDLTDFGADRELALVKSIIDSLKVDYYVCAGNHDANWSESGCNTFLRTFGYEHFSFERGGWRFMGCNSGPDMRMAPALIPRESMVWLRSVKEPRKTIFFNHYGADSTMLNYFEVSRELKRLDTRFMIGGHWHSDHTRDFCGLPGVTCRSSYRANHGNAGYNIVRVWPDSITFSDRRIYEHSTVELAPWHVKKLHPVRDTVTYDAHGLPGDYPWMRYEVNDRFPQVRESWKFQEEANIVAGFASDGRRAWYPTASGILRAISLKDGRRLWSRQFGGKIFSTPALSGNRLVFGCTDGFIYALRSDDGSLLWKCRTAAAVVASPLIRGNAVYIAASDGVFRKLDLKSGRLLWSYEGVRGHAVSTPFADDGQVVFGTWGRRLYSLDPETGGLQWCWQTHSGSRMISPASTVILKSAGRIFVAVPDRRVYALDAATGRELFHVEGGRDAIGMSEDGRRIYDKTMFGDVICFNADVEAGGPPAPVQRCVLSPETDEVSPLPATRLPVSALNWTAPDHTGYEISPTALAESAGLLLVPTDKGNIMGMDAVTGSFLWAHKLSIALINPLKVWRTGRQLHILASSMDGTVALLSCPVPRKDARTAGVR